MKKFKTIAVGSVLALIGLTACQETSERACQDVAAKIESNEVLSQDDYTRMIEYVGEFAQKSQDAVVNDPQGEMQGVIETLKKEYPLVDTFRDCIRNTPIDKFDADNQALIQKYAGLVEFTAPEGTEIQTNKEAAGIEVATPNSANGVVAGGVDQETVKK